MAGALLGGMVGVVLAFAGRRLGDRRPGAHGRGRVSRPRVAILLVASQRDVVGGKLPPARPFAGKTSGARVLGYVNLNADNFLIARFLGATPLGVYSVAYNVMFAPLARLATPIQQVLFPAFARIAADRPRAGTPGSAGAGSSRR